MKWKVGDQVKFLNDTGGGRVTRILNKDMVQVLNQDGFEIPVLATELLKADNSGQPVAEEPEQPEEPQGQASPWQEEGQEEKYDVFAQKMPADQTLESVTEPGNHVYFAFVPTHQKDPGQGDQEAYLINDSDFQLFYVILLKRESAWVYFASGNLEDNMKTFIKDIEQEHFNELGRFRFQLIFYQKGFYHPVAPIEVDLNMHPRKFFKSSSYRENDFFESPALILEIKKEEALDKRLSSLRPENIAQAVQEKEKHQEQPPSHSPREKDQDIEEVDLHIEELVDKPKELTNQQMLDIQMSKFQTSLEGALKTPKTKKLVVIHGVGNGRLRYEVRKYLDRYYPRLDYQDASFKEYGYGATLVFVGK